jgi:RHH-type transcriptional regulator, rel operon repressor / antitoxin RelB
VLYLYNTFFIEDKPMLAIRLPEDIEKRLSNLAKLTGRTKTFYARQAIEQHLDDLEDIYLAEQRLTDIRAGRTQTVAIEDILKRYDLED